MVHKVLVLLSLISSTALAKDELHWLICEKSPQIIAQKLSTSFGSEARMLVSYFDSPNLANYAQGVELRLRSELKGKTESTVKVLGLDEESVDAKWFDEEGFKCEADLRVANTRTSCSLTQTKDFFNELQMKFLFKYARREIRWHELKKFGPVREVEWKSKNLVQDEPLHLVSVFLPDGKTLMELSVKVKSKHSREIFGQFTKHFQNAGLQLCPDQKSKTFLILKAFGH